MFNLTNELKQLLTNKKMIIGVSAGVDSISLLHMLVHNGYQKQCIVAHVHHGFRTESDEEYTFVKQLCEQYEVQFEGIHLNIKEYMNDNHLKNEEKTARDLRYKFYKKIASKYDTNIICLGHHGDDLIEGVMMKVVKGVYGKGLIQMQEIHCTDDYTFVRPLLAYTKEDVYTYAKYHHLTWFEDKSNTDDKYTRNRFRKHIVPLLKEENPQLLKAMHQFSSLRVEEEAYFDKVVNQYYEEMVSINSFGIISINKESFLSLEPFLQRRLLYLIFTKQFKDIVLTGNLLDILKEKIGNNENTDYQLIVQGCYVVNSQKKFYLVHKKNEMMNEYTISDNKKFKKLFTDKKVPSAFRFILYKDGHYVDILENQYDETKVLKTILMNN